MSNSRRQFLRSTTFASLGLSLSPIANYINSKEQSLMKEQETKLEKGQQLVSILQTTDVHCQLHPHDELFWENDKIRVNANVFNVLDEYLYSGSWYPYLNAYNWQTESPRSMRLSIAYKF